MASRIEARVNPELLVWARETAGSSAGVAADRLKIPVDRLEARILHLWEQRRAEASDRTAEEQRRVSAIQQRMDKLDEAFLNSEAIDVTTERFRSLSM